MRMTVPAGPFALRPKKASPLASTRPPSRSKTRTTLPRPESKSSPGRSKSSSRGRWYLCQPKGQCLPHLRFSRTRNHDHPVSPEVRQRHIQREHHLRKLTRTGEQVRRPSDVHLAIDPEQLQPVLVLNPHNELYRRVRLVPFDAYTAGQDYARRDRRLGGVHRVPAAPHQVELVTADLGMFGEEGV